MFVHNVVKNSNETTYNDEQSIEFDGDDEEENRRRIYKFLSTFIANERK